MIPEQVRALFYGLSLPFPADQQEGSRLSCLKF